MAVSHDIITALLERGANINVCNEVRCQVGLVLFNDDIIFIIERSNAVDACMQEFRYHSCSVIFRKSR